MKKFMLCFFSLLAAGSLAGCGSSPESAGGENGQVYIFNYGDYVAPEVIRMFEDVYKRQVWYHG